MPLYRVQCSRNTSTGTISNTLYFIGGTQGSSPEPAEMDEIADRIDAAFSAMASQLARLATDDVTLLMYDMADPEPRVPVDERVITPTVTTGTSQLPFEVQICLSYRAAYQSGDPRGRFRGRQYLGPLRVASMTNVTASGSGPRPSETLIDNVLDFGEALATPVGSEPIVWVMYSPTDNEPRLIVETWCDNAPDTMRSRGVQVTTRTTRAVVQP